MPLVMWADVPLDQRGEPWMTRRRHPRLWWTPSGYLVTDGHHAATLLALGENQPPEEGLRAEFDRWLFQNQPCVPIGCPAAVRDRDGLYHPCSRPLRANAESCCWQHDPNRRGEIVAARRQRRAAWQRVNFQWCNWVGEGVPA